jgi:hypothetical protein
LEADDVGLTLAVSNSKRCCSAHEDEGYFADEKRPAFVQIQRAGVVVGRNLNPELSTKFVAVKSGGHSGRQQN